MPVPKPVRQQDWRFLMLLFTVTSFLELNSWGHLTAFTPLFLRNELNVPQEEIPRWTGVLASSSLVVALPLSPFWGVLADRYSRKAVIIRSLFVESLCFGALSLCADVWQMLAIRVCLGLAFGNLAVAVATQSIATPDRQVGTAIGIIQTGATVAQSAGPLLGSLVINTLGLRAMFAVDSALTLTAALLVLLAFQEPDLHDRTTPLTAKVRLVLQQVATVPPIRWNFVCWFLVFAGAGAMEPFLPVLIDRMVGPAESATAIGTLLAAYGLLTALGTPFAGRLADRVGAAPLFLAAPPVLAILAAAISLVSTLPALAALVILRAIPQAGTAVVLYSHLAAHVPSQDRAAVMSLTPMPRNAAWLVAPGMAAAASGFGLSGVFWLSAAIFALASVVALLMLRSSRAREGQARVG